jgi:hypothetical protein
MNEEKYEEENIDTKIEEMQTVFTSRKRKIKRNKSFRMIQQMRKKNKQKNHKRKKELNDMIQNKNEKNNNKKDKKNKCVYKNVADHSILFEPEKCSNIKNYKVVMLGCCKDVANYLHKNLMILELLGNQFLDYRMVIYENDSSDITRQILMEFKNDKFEFIFENDLKIKERTERLAYIRNILLDRFYQIQETFQADYMIMIDLDDRIFSGKLINSLSTCFGFDVDKWDVLTGNQSKIYYDVYALRIKNLIEHDFLQEILKIKKKTSSKKRKKIINRVLNRFNYPVISPSYLVPVQSAFGAIGIYKISSIKNAKYIGMKGKIPICEHVPFHKSICDEGGKIFINSHLLTE